MSNIIVALIAYVLDRMFGEVVAKKHPVAYMRDYIAWFEEHYYEESFERGVLLLLSLVLLAVALTYPVVTYLSFLAPFFTILFSGFLASLFISHKELINSTDSFVNAQKNYAKELNQKVTAPLLYLLVFGLYGAVVYTAVRTLALKFSSATARHEQFGKPSLQLFSWLNAIPEKVTALVLKYRTD